MYRALTLVSVLCICLPLLARAQAVPATDPEALARRLGETTRGMEELLAGKVQEVTITLRMEELDGEGNVRHVQQRVDRVRVKDGQHHREILQAHQDGEDTTEALRKELEERQRKGPVRTEFSSVNLPFTAASMPLHRFFLAEPSAREPHRLRLRFEPRADSAPWVHKGEALVDPSTGQLLRLSYSPTQLPHLARRVDVRMDFRAQPGMGQVLDTLHVDAEGGLLFYKKRLRITAHYSNLVPVDGTARASGSGR